MWWIIIVPFCLGFDSLVKSSPNSVTFHFLLGLMTSDYVGGKTGILDIRSVVETKSILKKLYSPSFRLVWPIWGFNLTIDYIIYSTLFNRNPHRTRSRVSGTFVGRKRDKESRRTTHNWEEVVREGSTNVLSTVVVEDPKKEGPI